jgi:hypothetical protein
MRSTSHSGAGGVSGRARRVALAAALITAAIVVVAATLGDGRPTPPGAAAPARPEGAVLAAEVAPASSPAAPGAAFPAADCAPASVVPGAVLGLGIPRPARLLQAGPERAVFDDAVTCLEGITGAPPTLRTQIPIDAARRAISGDDEISELRAFGALLATTGGPGIISIRAHDFTRCGRRGAPPSREIDELEPGLPLGACDYPTPRLYGRLFAEVRALADAIAPGVALTWTAWNEPDHPMFTLLDGLGSEGAARRAGEYWAQAASQVGDARVLAGEFSDRDPGELRQLRRAFVIGAGRTPAAWALHPYRDLTAPAAAPGQSVDEQFAADVAPAPVWLTEVTARLSGRRSLGGDDRGQLTRGAWLRAELERRPVKVMLYLLTPPDAARVAAGDTWDSAIADRQGRARPFICGLAGLPPERCPGDPAAFGG